MQSHAHLLLKFPGTDRPGGEKGVLWLSLETSRAGHHGARLKSQNSVARVRQVPGQPGLQSENLSLKKKDKQEAAAENKHIKV